MYLTKESKRREYEAKSDSNTEPLTTVNLSLGN